MSLSDWHLAVKLADQPLAPKSILRLPETELGEYSLGGYSISFLKQLIAGKLQESVPDPELIEPVDKVAALREFRVLHTALHSSSSYREAVFKMLSNKESLDQIIVATPGLSSDPIALGVLQDKDLFSVFADPSMLDTLVPAHPALVNAIVLSQWQPQLQQLRDMGIQDDELSLRALQATGGDIQAALELIFAGGAP
ncbi:ubiquitin-like protein [Camelus ferus]|nr:ubiquitin-like protein [Camelus ferus]